MRRASFASRWSRGRQARATTGWPKGIAFRELAASIGICRWQPGPAEEAAAHFGWLARFAALNLAASSTYTQQLGWHPTGAGLLRDMNQHYC